MEPAIQRPSPSCPSPCPSSSSRSPSPPEGEAFFLHRPSWQTSCGWQQTFTQQALGGGQHVTLPQSVLFGGHFPFLGLGSANARPGQKSIVTAAPARPRTIR